MSKKCWCGEADGKAMVKCSVCAKMIHYRCMGVSLEDLDELINDVPASYVCRKCEPNLADKQRSDLASAGRSKTLFTYKESDSSGSKMVSLGAGGGISEEALSNIIRIATKAASEGVAEQIKEAMEKREKKRNLVLVGYPEKGDGRSEQNEYDLKAVHKYCDQLQIDPKSVRTTFRDGMKTSGRPRIMKICFEEGCSQERFSFLVGAKKRMDTDPELGGLKWKPFVRPDMTFNERQQDKALREQVKELRDQGKDMIIRNGKIVPRPNAAKPGPVVPDRARRSQTQEK